MIIVIGHPLALAGPDGARPGGAAALAAMAAARSGSTVQLVGKIGDDEPGDAVVLALATAGVGHVALLRDPARRTPVVTPTVSSEDPESEADTEATVDDHSDADQRPTLEAADVELGLRYLTDYRVVVVADPVSDAILGAASEAARYAGAQLVVVAADASAPGATLPEEALVLAAADADPEGCLLYTSPSPRDRG